MKLTKVSSMTGSINTLDLDVTLEQVHRYNHSDELVQNIFPNLTAGEREFIMNGTTPKEWDEMFGTGEVE